MWETRHNTLASLQADMTLEPQAAPEYLVWYQNRTVTLVTNPSEYRQPQLRFQGSTESLHIMADSENPSQDFVSADPTQEYIPPRPPRTDRGGFQLGSARMRKSVATKDTVEPSSTPHVSPYRPASPHHHPSPPFEQMHFDSDFINLDPNAGGFFQTSYEDGHHSQHLGGDHIHNDQEDDQDQEDNRD
ncbi:OLC1v1025841C1 [Oldenlandia corymbosa var. corymbosa]|uniref:OLC1v1025841C1 n=1 Tax=Oldenlandia corymbosa var. corymbosa TaxID=529605 RepID=A0AAV1C8Q7_OLDCO|nr:OLC1v1025841C1 [Oldenlandia corymbosa var. corymbosa]